LVSRGPGRCFAERVGGASAAAGMFVGISGTRRHPRLPPVKLELTREERFIATSTRHPMRITLSGADGDGNWRRYSRVLSIPGLRQHAAVLFHACGESLASIIARTESPIRSSPIQPVRPGLPGLWLAANAVRGERDRTNSPGPCITLTKSAAQHREPGDRCCCLRGQRIPTCF